LGLRTVFRIDPKAFETAEPADETTVGPKRCESAKPWLKAQLIRQRKRKRHRLAKASLIFGVRVIWSEGMETRGLVENCRTGQSNCGNRNDVFACCIGLN
jgi:hypothetical protein